MNQLQNIKQKDLISECKFSASRSSGPGGQNVNKVNSQVILRFDVYGSNLLDEEEKQIILKKLGSYISGEGMLVLHAQQHRSQLQNKEEVVVKFNRLIEKAFQPRKIRKITRPSKAAVQKRLDEKKKRSEKKQSRQKNQRFS
ncbi:MAG TPA: alternative ribosome rescue aminoacyl-tRNA hydrolase ArfB [Cyclobacteriaceae bacterium]|nr:alternative ribosome rescue aminoacyl-tRNA hydrolase ArfB [Cyclobacteriaceae bacterium]